MLESFTKEDDKMKLLQKERMGLSDDVRTTSQYFMVNIIFLILFGVIMVFSSSYMYATENMGSSFFFVKKQVFFIILGAGLAFIFSKMKLNFLFKNAYLINGISSLVLTLTLIPGLKVLMKGSQRWINLGFMNVQPGEFIKFTMMVAAIKYFENFNYYSLKQRSLYFLGIVYPLMILIVQPDFGTFFISVLILAFISFLSSFPRKYFYSVMLMGIISTFIILISAPYRVKRLMTFLDPWKDPRGAGFQIIQSFLAFANGSITGQGLGNSHEKLFYLPEAYNDFIFSVIGEELGLLGVLFTVFLFLSFCYLGFKLAISLKSKKATMLLSSIIFVISLQAFMNMGVVLGVLPTKGLNLPFISYGGSSMVANLISIGLIFCCLRSGDERSSSSLKSLNVRTVKTFKGAFYS